MNETLRVLLVEDVEDDALLILRELQRNGRRIIHERVDTASAMSAALDWQAWDIVIADYSMPGFGAMPALELMHQRGLDLPFIVVSGTLGEDAAVAALRAGAHDYIMKGRWARLLPAIERELREADHRAEWRSIQADRDQLLAREQAARKTAETANRAKDEFLATLSHELRTPLTPIAAAIDLIQRMVDLPPAARELAADIRRHVHLEARLIDDLLDMAQLRTGDLRLDRKRLEVHALLRSSVSALQARAGEGQIGLALDLTAADSAVIGDEGRLVQLFNHLIENALKFTPAGGTVMVRTLNKGVASAEPTRLIIDIIDTGMGIEPDVLGRLFRPFEQADSSLTRRFGGLGRGLNLARALAELHGGTLTGASEGSGCGACFRVMLPTAPAAATTLSPPRLTTAPRVLLVEDNPDTLRLLGRLVKSFGCTVTMAESAASALQLAGDGPIDLLISDIGLPDRSGWELMRELSSKQPMRGIAISGFSSDDDIRRSHEAGFAAHLVKPVNVQQLEELVRQHAGGT